MDNSHDVCDHVDRDNNSTCSTSTSSGYRLFDRQTTLHQLMGGWCPVVEETVSWVSFLTLCSDVLLFLIVLRFLHANYASLRDKQIQALPELLLSEEMVNYDVASFRIKVNYLLLLAHHITLG
ncbi:hypothetical protein Hanom_Chr05g00425541 [Helianthus anomalus]